MQGPSAGRASKDRNVNRTEKILLPFTTEMQLPGASQSQGWEHYSSVFTAAKAGMDLVDKEHIKQICYEASKVHTKYHEQ